MEAMHITPDGAAHCAHQAEAGHIVWDAGHEVWCCELHRYTDREIRLDRCARGGDRLQLVAERCTATRFSVVYAICPPDSESPKCIAPVSDQFWHWGQAVSAACDLVLAFVRRAGKEKQYAVLGHWNPLHIIDDVEELQTWHWDGTSVLDLQRQSILLENFPGLLRQYGDTVPSPLATEIRMREPAPMARDKFSMAVIAVDQRGFALVRTVWYGADARVQEPAYSVLSLRTVQCIFRRYRRRWPGLHLAGSLAHPSQERP